MRETRKGRKCEHPQTSTIVKGESREGNCDSMPQTRLNTLKGLEERQIELRCGGEGENGGGPRKKKRWMS